MDQHMSRKRKGRKARVKVVYISSPVKVTTSATRFRALVQELTGIDSDVSRFVETNAPHHHDPHQTIVDRGMNMNSAVDDRASESPTSSGSLFEPSFDDYLVGPHGGQGSFVGGGMFPSSFSFEGFEFDHVLGGYGAG